jgi:hypothetical protein
MQASELAFFTTKELISELVRRRTFLGVVVHSEKEFKRPEWGGERMFKVHFNSNLGKDEVARLLERVSDYMDWNHC